jgi:hypothetical protein
MGVYARPRPAAALVVAHPGHEFCLLDWCRRARPRLSILTTGSRSGGDRSRLQAVLEGARARGLGVSPLAGSFEDRVLYRHILRGEVEPLRRWSERLGDDLVEHGIAQVVVDAWQGYSPAHDLTHVLARAAVRRAEAATGLSIELLEFAPVCERGWPRRRPTPLHTRLELDAAAAAAKLDLARAVPDLARELDEDGVDLERGPLSERLYATASGWSERERAERPYYERVGELRVAEGVYSTVLRQSHLMRIVDELLQPAFA